LFTVFTVGRDERAQRLVSEQREAAAQATAETRWSELHEARAAAALSTQSVAEAEVRWDHPYPMH
jgi:hypothetical protein